MAILDFDVKLEETWRCMEECVKQGFTRSIGVSNTNQSQLERLMKSGSIKPAMNQIESHPIFQNKSLIQFCHENNIAVTAYAPFGAGRVPQLPNDESTLCKIAKQHNKTPAQVCIRWQIQRGNVVIPKSVTPERIAENASVWDFQLSESEMNELANLDTNVRYFKGDFPGAKLHPEYAFLELKN